jgi:predicted deacetylase
MERALIVSIHDVAPPFESDIDAILARLKALGISRCSLLVVPDYHGTGRIDDNPAWAARLKRWQADGHEIILHGYFHRVEAKGSPDLQSAFLRNVYTASESEFLELDFAEATSRLRRGMEVFESVGLATKGFVAPAWLMGDEAFKAIGKAGFEYTNTLKKIIDLKTGRVCDCWTQVYSSRAAWRRCVSIGWNELLWQARRREKIVRVSIHPPEIRYPMLWNHLESLIRRAETGRQTLTYVDFVDRLRAETAS